MTEQEYRQAYMDGFEYAIKVIIEALKKELPVALETFKQDALFKLAPIKNGDFQ